jgi:hypothetical protein
LFPNVRTREYIYNISLVFSFSARLGSAGRGGGEEEEKKIKKERRKKEL